MKQITDDDKGKLFIEEFHNLRAGFFFRGSYSNFGYVVFVCFVCWGVRVFGCLSVCLGYFLFKPVNPRLPIGGYGNKNTLNTIETSVTLYHILDNHWWWWGLMPG